MGIAGKTVVLGISSSIAIYKAAGLVSRLKKLGADVHVVMTVNATKLMSPVIFEELSGNKCSVDTFDRNFQWNVQHISLAKAADVFVVAPATANVIGKIAHGICDDMLTTTVCACTAPKILVPAMNVNMYQNPITQENITKLVSLGYTLVEPGTGLLACGDVGKGRFPDESLIIDAIVNAIGYEKDLAGKKVLVSTGATQEALDPIRFITNHSTGKMGLAMAQAARYRGAEVTLVLGPNRLDTSAIHGIKTVSVTTALEMKEAMLEGAASADIICMAAAVSDFRPAAVAENKIKKATAELTVNLMENPDILAAMGEKKPPGQKICGFSMETRDLVENSRKKLLAKNADMIVANDLTRPGAGFGVDTNIVTLLTKDGEEAVERTEKKELAHIILDRLLAL